MPTATLTTKGRITIPMQVRKALGIEPGDRVEFVAGKNGTYTMVARTRDVRYLKGLVKKSAKPVSIGDMKRPSGLSSAAKRFIGSDKGPV